MMLRTRTVRRGPRPLFLFLALAAASVALVLPASVSAAGWAGFGSITSNTGVTQPKISADPAGNQVAVWVEQPSPFRVMAAFRPAGGSWGAPQTLDSTATTLPNTDVAQDGSGGFIVVMSQIVGTTYKVFSSYLAAGSTSFGAQQQLGTTLIGTPTISAPTVAFDGQGRAHAAYGINGGTAFAGIRPSGAGSTWTTVATGLPTNSQNPDIAVTAAGEATIADYPIGGGALRHWRLPANGAAWSQLTTPIGAGNPTGAPIIAVDDQGRTTVLHLVASTFTQIASQTCPAGLPATCSAKVQLAQLGATNSAGSPALAVSGAGDAAAAWTEAGTNAVAVSQRSGSGGSWSAPVQIGQGATPALAFTSSGTTVALHEQTGNLVRFALAPAGGVFTPPSEALTDPVTTWVMPRVATDSAGNAFGVWAQSGGAGLQSAVYDAQVPVLSSFAIPSSATAGQAAPFAVTASDAWSGTSLLWEFGDGATSTDPSGTHSYAAPGVYTARVTATDGAGNQATQTQTVTVAQAPTGPQPLSRPIAGSTVNLEPVTGTVLVRVPGSTTFVPLTSPTQVQAGSVIDARRGRVRITIDNGLGGLDTADFFGGVFRFTQPAVKTGLRRFANLHLFGGRFKGCPRAPRKPRIAGASAKRRKKSASRSVRHLWGEGKGAFRTVGRFSSATIRGTTWLTDDKCNGTLTRVTVGKVGVRDFVKRRTIIVKARRKYLAKPAPARKSTRRARR